MDESSENMSCEDCEYYRPDGVFGPFPGMMPGFPGMFPGFPGMQPGFPGQPPFGLQPGFPGQPPFGPQPGFPGQPPFGPPFGGGLGSGPPAGPPPQFIPNQANAQQTVGAFAIDPGAIRRCMFRFVFIWLINGQQFWAWLVFVGRDSIAGWRWTGFNWVFFGIDLRQISSFVCY